jgi:hypothetical protein
MDLAIGACTDGQNLGVVPGYQSGASQANALVFGYYGDCLANECTQLWDE